MTPYRFWTSRSDNRYGVTGFFSFSLRVAAVAAVLAAAAHRAAAIEISLEENKAGQGKLGYVDMRRVFNAFPETMHAKESFDEIVEATEEKINLKRAEILRMRNSIDELRIERDFIVKKMPMRAGGRRGPPPRPAPPAVSTGTARAPAPAVGGRGPSGASLPGLGVSSATARAAAASAVAGSSAAVEAPPPAASIAVSSAPGRWPPPPASVAVSSPSARAGVVKEPAPAGAPPGDPALAKIDQELQAKTLELARMEADFKETESKAEENLLKLEKRKTEIILGNIYKILREVARENDVTVVVDSKQILYGYKGVDLTDKLIRRLRKKK